MSVPRPARVLALALLTTVVPTGCGAAEQPAARATTPAAAVTGATPTSPASAVATSATADPSGSTSPSRAAVDCDPGTPGAVPDGTWTGPLTMDVRGSGGGKGYADSVGTGVLRVVVDHGRVTSGTWRVRWTSTGHVKTGQAAARIDLVGTIKGTVHGPANRPALDGRWRIKGSATVTEPVDLTTPIDETGTDDETLTILTSTCAAVTGTFVPSFNSKDAAAEFTGRATWAGTPTG